VGPLYPAGETPGLPRGYRVVRRLPDGSMIARIVARPAQIFFTPLHGFYSDGWLGGSNGSLLACAEQPGLHIARFLVASLARDRRVRIGTRELSVPGGGPQPMGTALRLRSGCQAVDVEVLGPPADRASEVMEGNPDPRELSINLFPKQLEYVRLP